MADHRPGEGLPTTTAQVAGADAPRSNSQLTWRGHELLADDVGYRLETEDVYLGVCPNDDFEPTREWGACIEFRNSVAEGLGATPLEALDNARASLVAELQRALALVEQQL